MNRSQLYHALCGNALGHYTGIQISGKEWETLSDEAKYKLIEDNEWEPLEGYPSFDVLHTAVGAADSQLRLLEHLDLLLLAPEGFKEVYRTVAISTAHLSPSDKEILTQEMRFNPFSVVAERYSGYFIKVPATLEDLKALSFFGQLSTTAQSLLELAVTHKFNCVEFDCDAPMVDGFEYHD